MSGAEALAAALAGLALGGDRRYWHRVARQALVDAMAAGVVADVAAVITGVHASSGRAWRRQLVVRCRQHWGRWRPMGDPHLVGALLLARDLYPEARFVLLGDDALARLKVRRPRGCPLDALAFGLNQGRSVRLLGARRLPEAGSTVAGLYDLPPVSP